jgi:hypothetical protein
MLNVLIFALAFMAKSHSYLDDEDRPIKLLDGSPQVEGHLHQAIFAIETLG